MRLATLGFFHESNTFVHGRTGLAQFVETEWLYGDAIRRFHQEDHSSMAGFLAIGEQKGVEVVPLVFARATPSGAIASEAFERIADEMVELLEHGGTWDGVLLVLHGAAVSEEFLDADGELIARVRAAVGKNVPIGLTLDMHANVSRRMIENVTATTMYRTNPHVDARERAAECAQIIVRAIRGEVRPVQGFAPLPAVINILRQATSDQPMREIVDDIERVLDRPGVLSASVAQGYPYADVAEMGMASLVVHDGSPSEANAAARWLAEQIWGRRADFVGVGAPVEEALLAAAAAPAGPVVLMDVGDNIGGGAPGDSTVLLDAARRLGVGRLLMILLDAEAVDVCRAAGPGQRVKMLVGGKSDRYSEAVEVAGRVRSVADGRFEEPTPTHGGFRHFDPGVTAVLDTDDDHTLVLMSRLVPPVSIRQLTTVGIQPSDYAVVVAKGVQSPRPAYEPVAIRIILVDTPGVTSADLPAFDYVNRSSPLFPFEAETRYPF